MSTGGYSGLLHVDIDYASARSNKDDKMESFFLAETLKYLVRAHSLSVFLPESCQHMFGYNRSFVARSIFSSLNRP